MKKYVLIILIITFASNLSGQFFRPDPVGYEYFNKGSELINLGDFKGADSLLTLALCSYKDENVYYNRALARFLQTDTLGFCQDMSIAANRYFDNQAEQYFNSICCRRVDTLYYDKSRVISDKSNYRYYEIIKYPIYDSVINGSFHDIKSSEPRMSFDFGCDKGIIGVNTSSTDMIAGYLIEDSVKYYFKSTKSISIFNLAAYEDLMDRAKVLLSTKYSFLKSENDTDKLKVFFDVYFNEFGDVVKVKYIGFYPEIASIKDISKLEMDLLDIADSYPKVKPARFFKEYVASKAYDFVEF